MSMIEKPLDVEYTVSMYMKNMWHSQNAWKERKIDFDDAGNGTETTSADDPTLFLIVVYED